MSLSNLKELVMERKPGMLQSMGLQRSEITEATYHAHMRDLLKMNNVNEKLYYYYSYCHYYYFAESALFL